MKRNIGWGLSLGQLISAIVYIVIAAGLLSRGEEAIRGGFLGALVFMAAVVGGTLSMWEILRPQEARDNGNAARMLSSVFTDSQLSQVAEIIAIVHVAFYREDAEDSSNVICSTCGGLSSKGNSGQLSLVIVRSHTADCLIGKLENALNDFAETLVKLYQVVRYC